MRKTLRYGLPALLLILPLAAALSGCAGPGVSAPGGRYASPVAALRSLAASEIKGPVTATARVEILRFGERYPSKLAIMMQRPARLRLESIPLLGPPDFFLSIDDGELRVFLPEKGAFYIGRATAANLSRFFPLALPAADVVSLLMGQRPQETAPDLQGEADGAHYRIDGYTGGERTISSWIDPAGDRLVRLQRFAEGERVDLTAEFADPVPVGGGLMPRQVTLSGWGAMLTIRYTEILPGQDDAAVFTLPLPEGITPMPLE